MAVRKICKAKGCRSSPRCEHPWYFDVMYRQRRWRMHVDDFALPRGATEPITTKKTAEREWEPKFLAEIVAGRNPRVKPIVVRHATESLTVAKFLDRYYIGYVEAEGLRSRRTMKSRLKAIAARLGALPVSALERREVVQGFTAAYRGTTPLPL